MKTAEAFLLEVTRQKERCPHCHHKVMLEPFYIEHNIHAVTQCADGTIVYWIRDNCHWVAQSADIPLRMKEGEFTPCH